MCLQLSENTKFNEEKEKGITEGREVGRRLGESQREEKEKEKSACKLAWAQALGIL